jgi:hypothetical protein
VLHSNENAFDRSQSRAKLLTKDAGSRRMANWRNNPCQLGAVRGHHRAAKPLQGFSGTAVVVVTSQGLIRVDDGESRSASGDCEGDSNKYEDFFHAPILSRGSLNYTTGQQVFVTRIAENYA